MNLIIMIFSMLEHRKDTCWKKQGAKFGNLVHQQIFKTL
jgi:hypothetical protein